MKRTSLTARLALLFALLSFSVLATLGLMLYRGMEQQLSLRDDAALLTRVEQLRTLLQDANAMQLIADKPQLFANMMGNREAMLVLRYPGQAPLIVVNPGNVAIPELTPVAASAPLTLAAVHHSSGRDGIPYIAMAATTRTANTAQELQIITGKLMLERSTFLAEYRNRILLYASAAALLTALFAYLVTRRGLLPLRRLAGQTAAIGIHSLATRIDSAAAPRELLPLIEAFNAMLDRLELSFTQLSQVSADMAHDLRTPIGILLGQTEVALGQRRDVAYYEKLLGSNFEELQRIAKMSDNMLFLARAEHADNAIERKALDLADELGRMTDYFEGPAEERQLRLECHGAGSVWADPTLLRRALANLLANAVRYAEPGSAIVLLAEAGPAGTSISVSNRGASIEAHHLARLFDRFYRADASRRDTSGSSGLGLSIVRSIMTLHQGSWAASSDDGHTRFTLFFPIQVIPS